MSSTSYGVCSLTTPTMLTVCPLACDVLNDARNTSAVRGGDLVNGSTVVVDDADDLNVIGYFHIMFDSHDIVDAQGVACESLLDAAHVAPKDSLPASSKGVPATTLEPCAPVLGFNGRHNELKSRLRSALSPIVDIRPALDRIRDRIKERAH